MGMPDRGRDGEVDRLRWRLSGRVRWRLPKDETTPQLEQEFVSVTGDVEWRPVETVIDES